MPEETGKTDRIRTFGAGIVGDWLFGKVEAEHGSDSHQLSLSMGIVERSGNAFAQKLVFTLKLLVLAGFAQLGEGCYTSGHRQGIAGKSTGLIHWAKRGDLLHNFAASAVSANGQTATDDLAKAGEIGRDPCAPLHAVQADAEASQDFVKDQEGAKALSKFAQLLKEAGRGQHQSHIGCHRF